MIDPYELSDLMRFKQGRTAPEPTIRSEPRGKLHCACGDSFGPHEFNRWQAHVRQCDALQTEE